MLDRLVKKTTMMKTLGPNPLLLYLTAHALQWWPSQAQVPTPQPTLFPGYDYQACVDAIDESDVNNDGFITKDTEYLGLINRIGAIFCQEPRAALTAEQGSAYFTLVCELNPSCVWDSQLAVNNLSRNQILKICSTSRGSIYSQCPQPTASPTRVSMPNSAPTPPTRAPVPSPTTSSTPPPFPKPAPIPTPPSPASQAPQPTTPQQPTPDNTPTPPTPTTTTEEVAPGVTLEQCRGDLIASDADNNREITQTEFVSFLQLYGGRVCYQRPAGTTGLTPTELATYNALICVAIQPQTCDNTETEILVADSSFTSTNAETLCKLTYTNGMNGPVCNGGGPAPTPTPPTPTPPTSTGSPVAATQEDPTATMAPTNNETPRSSTPKTVTGATTSFSLGGIGSLIAYHLWW